MDDFGVLVESIGFKTQVKSAPMAHLKGKTNISSGISQNFGINSGSDTKPSSVKPNNSSSINGSFVEDLDGIFRSNNSRKTQNHGGLDGYDDVFGGPILNSKQSESRPGGDGGSMFDLNSMFKGSNNSGVKSPVSHLYDDGDDIFGGMPGLKSSATVNNDNVFGSMASPPRQTDSIDDLLGNFGGMGSDSNGSRRNSGKVEEIASEFDDLIPGFGGNSPSSNGANSGTSQSKQSSGYSAKSTFTLVEDPFVVLESASSQAYSSRPFSNKLEQDARKSSGLSSIDEFEKGQRIFGEGKGASEVENYLDSFLRKGAEPSSVSRLRSTTVDPLFDTLFQNRNYSEVERTYSQTSSSTNKASTMTNIFDDPFGAAPSSGEFQEIEGESEERRKARLNHHLRTQDRMAKALAEKNQRDLQAQREQDERLRIAETLDDDIKRWAVGKEGNLRALLSSLQYVLWAECGWQPVSLADLITSTSVKKIYHKATLCVHPDKVQQKGANLQQKYIAEKVFDLLKEAWNKFSSEELR